VQKGYLIVRARADRPGALVGEGPVPRRSTHFGCDLSDSASSVE